MMKIIGIGSTTAPPLHTGWLPACAPPLMATPARGLHSAKVLPTELAPRSDACGLDWKSRNLDQIVDYLSSTINCSLLKNMLRFGAVTEGGTCFAQANFHCRCRRGRG